MTIKCVSLNIIKYINQVIDFYKIYKCLDQVILDDCYVVPCLQFQCSYFVVNIYVNKPWLFY